MIEVRPWIPCPPADDQPHVKSAWHLAENGANQNPLQVRTLYDGDELLAFGGVVAFVPADGLAFLWHRPGVSLYLWRRILPVCRVVMWGAHERGMRRISAIVAAMHAKALRFIKAMGFRFAGVETGFAGTTEPMLRYCHCWPEFSVPALVAHQLRETELACHALWCPEVM
jgi:hypothetical protein